MKKKFLAVVFAALMFPLALLLTACGGGKLQTGKIYAFEKAEIIWGSNEEKELFLGFTGVSETEWLATLLEGMPMPTLVFNEDETVVCAMDTESVTSYYSVDGNTVNVYVDQAKTELSVSMKIEGDSLVQETPISETSATKIRMIYKVTKTTLPEGDGGDGEGDGEEGGSGFQVGKIYGVEDIEFNWANEQEKQQILDGADEQLYITMMKSMMADSTVVFNQDGSVVAVSFGYEAISYYTLNETTITIYTDAEKTQQAAILQIVNNTLVQEQAIEDGMQSTAKVTYKIKQTTPGGTEPEGGEGQLQIGAYYIFDKLEMVWANDSERDLFLGMVEMTEQEFIAAMSANYESVTFIFNNDGTAVSQIESFGETLTQTMYYEVDGTTVVVYEDAEKTIESSTLIINGDTIISNMVIGNGINSQIKVTFKLQG